MTPTHALLMLVPHAFRAILIKIVGQYDHLFLYNQRKTELFYGEKGRDLTQPYDEHPKRQTMHMLNETKTLQIRSITPLLRTELGRPAGATTVIQPVWLTRGLRAQPSHFPQSPFNQKDKHLKVNKPPYRDQRPKPSQVERS